MRFILVGEESAGARALALLLRSQHTVVGVMSGDQRLGASSGLPTWPSKLVKDPATARLLVEHDVDVLLNVYSMVQVAPDVLRAPRVGSFNLHPGILPHVAGRNPISAALHAGHAEHGVTLHHMVTDFDAGPIAFQATFLIEDSDNAMSLSAKCVRAGEMLIADLLAAALDGTIPSRPQDLSLRRYFAREMPEQGKLDFTRPARTIVDFVRAYDFYPFASRWGHPTAILGGREVALARARLTGRPTCATPGVVVHSGAGSIAIAARDEWVEVTRICIHGEYVAAERVLEGHSFGRRDDSVPHE